MAALSIGSRVLVYGKAGVISGTTREGWGIQFDDGTSGVWGRSVVQAESAPAPRRATSIRLSAEADRQLELLSTTLGINRTAVLELAIRKLAAQESVQ